MSLLRHHESNYRSLPGTPYGMDPRAMAGREYEEAMHHARIGVDGDYFSGISRHGGGLRPISPYGGYDQESYGGGPSEMGVTDQVRRTNLAVSLANSSVASRSSYGQIHPKICVDGRYPSDFQLPKTVEEVKVLDGSQLDRILQAYRLPLDLRSVRMNSRESLSSKSAHQAKLQVLFEFLGASRITEHEKLKRNMY